MFELFVSVADAQGVWAAILLFFVLGAAGIWAILLFMVDNWPVILFLGSLVGLVLYRMIREMVDIVLWVHRQR